MLAIFLQTGRGYEIIRPAHEAAPESPVINGVFRGQMLTAYPGISAYSRAASAALQHGRRPGSNTAAARPGERPCRTPGRAGFPPRPPRSATFPAPDRGAVPQNGNSGNTPLSSISPAYNRAVQRQTANVFVIVGTPPLHKGADRRLFLPGQFTAHVCPLSLP